MSLFKVRSRLLLLGLALVFAFEAAGCEAMARKFVRKPKAGDKRSEEVVFAPEEYKGEGVSKRDLYYQYFLYWRTWQDELIDSLERGGNRKRQIDCLDEGIKNLGNLEPLMKPEKTAQLDAFIKKLMALRQAITEDIYGNKFLDNRRQAESLKRQILREFSLSKVKDSII